MKFALFAIAAVGASQVVIPSIEWNNQKINEAGKTVEDFVKKAKVDHKEDVKLTVTDLSKAYSRMKVHEYVSFGKYLKPLAERDVEIIDSLTVSG